MRMILATDANASFAFFTYEGFDIQSIEYIIGFDVGNQMDHDIIRFGSGPVLKSMIVYRIDG